MRVVFGIRCPACGMTTSWAHFTRGNFGASVSSNFGGFLLAILTLAVSPMAVRYAWRSEFPGRRQQSWLLVALLIVLAATMIEWAIRLAG